MRGEAAARDKSPAIVSAFITFIVPFAFSDETGIAVVDVDRSCPPN